MNTTSFRTFTLAATLACAFTANALDDKPGRDKPTDRRETDRVDKVDRERAVQDKVPRREGDRAAEPRRGERDGDRDAEILKVRAKLEELAAGGNFEDAAKLKAHLAELMERRATTRDAATPEIRELQLKLKQLVAEERYEEAAQVKRRLGELVEKNFDARKPDAKPDSRPEGKPVDGERRLQELAAMVEKLRAAGQLDEAEKLAREAGELRRQMGERGVRGDRPIERPDVRGRDPRADEYQTALKELRAEMAELHRAVAEMRKLLEEKKR